MRRLHSGQVPPVMSPVSLCSASHATQHSPQQRCEQADSHGSIRSTDVQMQHTGRCTGMVGRVGTATAAG